MKKTVILFMAALLLCSAACLLSVQSSPSDGERVGQRAREESVTRILVMGRDRAASLCDSIFVVSVNKETRDVRLLQIPRDTYARYTDRDYKKLNGAYATLGLEETKDFLSHALGVPIHHTILLDLDAVRELVDAVGGVDVEIPQEMHYADPEQGLNIDLSQGVCHLNGEQAEQFLRFRSGYVNADLGRMDAQKIFLQAYARKSRELGKGRLIALSAKMITKIKTDLPVGEMVSLMNLFFEIDASSVPMATAPGVAVQGTSGAWYYSLCRAEAVEAVRYYLQADASFGAADFDPDFVFDRQDHEDFHRIYTAPTSDAAK